MAKCFKCGTEGKKLIEHHLSYEPEIKKECCLSCHRKLHRRLRRDGKCVVAVDKLRKINQKLYKKNTTKRLTFTEFLEPNVMLQEVILYNAKTGTVFFSSQFTGHHGHNLHKFPVPIDFLPIDKAGKQIWQ